MEKEFVPYELAFRLKALGFDRRCFGWYYVKQTDKIQMDNCHNLCGWLQGDNCSAPTFSQAFKWFRDNYGMFHNVDKIFSDEFGYIITNEKDEPLNDFDFNTWEEAELSCLEKLIEIVESKTE